MWGWMISGTISFQEASRKSISYASARLSIPLISRDSWTKAQCLRFAPGSPRGILRQIVLEIIHPHTDALIRRWDIDVVYGWSASGDGSFWTDTDQLKYHIRKAGVASSDARYRLLMKNKQGWSDVAGWGSTEFRSTEGMVRQSLGSTIEHSGLGANAAYWRNC